MANNHRQRKDYTALLHELQQEFHTKQQSTTNTEDDIKSSSVPSKTINLDYDLDLLLKNIHDLKSLTDFYNYCESQIDYEQEITQDLLHAIEFSKDCKERYKLSTQLHYCRQRRRQYKNVVTVLKPMIEYLNKDETKKCLNKIINYIGEARKTKQNESNRTYTPRILTELGEICNGHNK